MEESRVNAEMRVESSVPVQARVSMIDLARLDAYWREVEGVTVRSMSQLVAWSVSALVEVIENNGKMPKGIGSVREANRHLVGRGLYQRSMMKRNRKVETALRFESMREEGIDPKVYDPREYNQVHNKQSVQVFEGAMGSALGGAMGADRDVMLSDSEWKEIQDKIGESKKVEVGEVVKVAKESGVVD